MNKSIWQRRQLVQGGCTRNINAIINVQMEPHKTLSLLIRSGGCVIERCSRVTHGGRQRNGNVFQRNFKRKQQKLTAVKVNQAKQGRAFLLLFCFFSSRCSWCDSR
jgi:hypothetical protein